MKKVVVVERSFEEPAVIEELEAHEKANRGCLEMRNVTFVNTFIALDRKKMFCIYEGPDAESVREAQREAGMPFDRVWTADTH